MQRGGDASELDVQLGEVIMVTCRFEVQLEATETRAVATHNNATTGHGHGRNLQPQP